MPCSTHTNPVGRSETFALSFLRKSPPVPKTHHSDGSKKTEMRPSALEDFELPILAHVEPELAPEAVRVAVGDPDL